MGRKEADIDTTPYSRQTQEFLYKLGKKGEFEKLGKVAYAIIGFVQYGKETDFSDDLISEMIYKDAVKTEKALFKNYKTECLHRFHGTISKAAQDAGVKIDDAVERELWYAKTYPDKYEKLIQKNKMDVWREGWRPTNDKSADNTDNSENAESALDYM